MQRPLKIELSVSGETTRDLSMGLKEIQDQVEAALTEGQRSWETGSYAFVVMGEEAPVPQQSEAAAQSDNLHVTIMYRNSFEGGDGWTYYALPVVISAFCPECGQRRGVPQIYPQCEDGEWFFVSQWTNPCGHKDPYRQIWEEAQALKKGEVYRRTPQKAQS